MGISEYQMFKTLDGSIFHVLRANIGPSWKAIIKLLNRC